MPIAITSTTNLRSLWSFGRPLGVTCGCGRRALVTLEQLGAHDGNMRLVSALPLVCSSCGSRNWAATIFASQAEQDGFLAEITGAPGLAT